MSSDWQNKEAQMRYTAEYMANEYKNESANMKYKYNELKKTVKELIKAIPQDRILWQQDVKELVDKVEEQMEEDDVRD
jgi:16S rRNA C967 or C1407 C5-methylase (RsmB/RsmF family)